MMPRLFWSMFVILQLLINLSALAAAPGVKAGKPAATQSVSPSEVRLEVQNRPRKILHQVLCVEGYKARKLQCLQSKGDGKLQTFKGGSLAGILKRHRLFGVPVLLVGYTGKINILYMPERKSDLVAYPFDLLAQPGPELMRQSWGLDFWYALDDAHWLEFEKEFLSIYSGQLEPGALRTLRELTGYQNSRDGELDGRYTLERIRRDAGQDGR